MVKLPGYVPCAAIPLWNKNDLFTLQSSHFCSRKKSVPKGSYAGVTGCCCAWERGLRSSSATSPCGTPAGCSSPAINLRMVDSAFSLATPAGLSLFRKALKNQQARNPGRQENTIGGSSNMILQCKTAAKLCWRCRGITVGERGVAWWSPWCSLYVTPTVAVPARWPQALLAVINTQCNGGTLEEKQWKALTHKERPEELNM